MALSKGIDTYIIKTVSWCNLDCSYCYYYHGADTSFMKRPRHMAGEVIEAAIPKMIDHSLRRGIDKIDITLHGGEPLLQPKEDCQWMMEQFDRIDAAGIQTRRKLTTNGLPFDDAWGELLSRWQTWVGVSIDGPQQTHDRFRVDHAGRGSYDRTVRGLQNALAWQDRGLNVGTITVIDPTASGAEAYRHLRGLGVRMMNFLLPENNYAHPPAGFEANAQGAAYGRFLTELFDAWVAEDDESVAVRLFQELINGLVGGMAATDQAGAAPVQVAVIETDGSIEPTDNFKSCTDRLTDLGLSVFEHTFDNLYDHEFFQYCTATAANLPEDCAKCPFVKVCGGGRISSRYSHEDGFSRKTIYCQDVLRLYEHVQSALVDHGLV